MCLDTKNFPVYLKFLGIKEIPGGILKESVWHRVTLRIKKGKALIFWNGRNLGGTPFENIRNYGGLGETTTRVDPFY